MSYTNRDLIECALKRVNALAGTNGKLYKDNTGWFVKWGGNSNFCESSRETREMLSYLHGIEDAYKCIGKKNVFILQDTNDGSIIGVHASREKAIERQSECIRYYDTRCFKVVEKEVED